ncbi:hypothetical protein [Alkalicoccobacillus porphyridii]|uniref:Uncharacterized protein n=1 Tax=Alkalicoccobacillus porphyridii TaxID=2597270 RepID=A0A554A484_9BACI|nr:hypothetical protein [Alkalicoccobacillus porphyridii]TSB48491.1 hypothetical protein FN960_02755 [Alkalicoccobacillus porphyridii]
MDRLTLRAVVPTSAVLLLATGCNTDKPAEQAEWEHEYVEHLTQVEEELAQTQDAVIRLFNGLMEDGHYVNSLLHIEEKQDQLDESMTAFIDRTTEDGVPEAYLELHIQLLYLKSNHEEIVTVGEQSLADDELLERVDDFAQTIEKYDQQLEEYQEKVEENDRSTNLSPYRELLHDKDYSVRDLKAVLVGMQIDGYVGLFHEHMEQFMEEEIWLEEYKNIIEETGLSEISEEERQDILEAVDQQRAIVQAFLNQPYPNEAEDLYDFLYEEAQEFLDLNLLLYSSVDAGNELLAQDTVERLNQLAQEIETKKEEKEQIIEEIKQRAV